MKKKIQYIGFVVFVMSVCTLLFASYKPEEGKYIYKTNGEKIDVKEINFNPSNYNKEDSTVKRGSLDGDQNVPLPFFGSKPFDPNQPFTKLTFRIV